MSGNKIDLRQINYRLGDMNKPRPRDPYAEDGGGNYDSGGQSAADAGTAINAGFIAGVVALFLTVSGGTYFFASGTSPFGLLNLSGQGASREEFVSKVDAICKPLWKSPGWNGDALACYMIENPSRFCDANEKDYFLARFKQYRVDIQLQKSAALAEVVLGQNKIFEDIQKKIDNQEKGIANPKPKKRPKVQNKYLVNKNFEEVMMDFQEKVLNPSKREEHPELSSLVRRLVTKGYFVAGDFGMFRDQIVADALAEPIGEVPSPCKPAAT